MKGPMMHGPCRATGGSPISALWRETMALGFVFLTAILCGVGAGAPHGLALERIHGGGLLIEDSDVTLAVETELMLDDAVSSRMIDVSTENGVVTLSGEVDNWLARQRAVTLAESVKGVRAVLEHLAIRPPGRRSDAAIARDVEAALTNDPATASHLITPRVADGRLVLTGRVGSWAQRRLAERVAGGVTGVVAVDNQIEIALREERPDGVIREEIAARLAWDAWVDASELDVEVNDGVVVLSGTVGSAQERTRAYVDAWVAGVEAVNLSRVEVDWRAHEAMERSHEHAVRPDALVRQAVQDALRYEPRVFPGTVSVSVRDGRAILTGAVDNLKAKRAAEEAARQTVGVSGVVNHVKIRPRRDMADEAIARELRAGLARDPYLDRLQLRVSVHDGTAYLRGTVHTLTNKLRAGDVAARTPGVVKVINRIQARTRWEPKSDREIHQDIVDQLWWSPYVSSEDVEVEVTDGIATLTGVVDSWQALGAAVENAYEGGARGVRNDLVVGFGREDDRDALS